MGISYDSIEPLPQLSEVFRVTEFEVKAHADEFGPRAGSIPATLTSDESPELSPLAAQVRNMGSKITQHNSASCWIISWLS